MSFDTHTHTICIGIDYTPPHWLSYETFHRKIHIRCYRAISIDHDCNNAIYIGALANISRFTTQMPELNGKFTDKLVPHFFVCSEICSFPLPLKKKKRSMFESYVTHKALYMNTPHESNFIASIVKILAWHISSERRSIWMAHNMSILFCCSAVFCETSKTVSESFQTIN